MIPSTTYIIDNEDVIISTGSNWSEFARENGTTLIDNVIGQSIWTFISNEKVQELYKQLFNAVRNLEKNIAINFRCDSDQVMRYMEMAVIYASDHQLKIETSTIKEVPRKRILSSPIIYLGIQHGTKMCSCCNKIYLRHSQQWFEIDYALDHNLIPEPLNVNFDLCERCKLYLQKKVQLSMA